MVVPGSQQVKAQAEREGLDEVFKRAGFDWRGAGCSMCLGMNPDIAGRRRARRVDLEPQLRGAPGTRRALAPGLAADGRRGGDRGPLRRHPQLELGGRHESDRDDHRARVACSTATTSTPTRSSPSSSSSGSSAPGFGEFLFFDWAKEPGWELPKNPILVAGRNFGCGSSREHAPWALEDYGFQAIIAPSFADIFRSNCTKIGLLPVELDADACASIAEAGEAQVDLAGQEVRWPGGTAQFEIDPEIKHRLLNGLDDIALTLEQGDAIAAYERDRERSGPVTTAL